MLLFFFQAEDGIRDLVRSRGLGDVYKRQGQETEGPYTVGSFERLAGAAHTLVERQYALYNDDLMPAFEQAGIRIPVSYTHLTLPTSDLV